jgi:hypothetical protein
VIELINCTLYLVDGSSRSLDGIVRDLQVKVDNFFIPCDFIMILKQKISLVDYFGHYQCND